MDLVPGETVLLHVINGGLEVHEAVIGDAAVQDAWEVAEAATAGASARARRRSSACRRTSPALRIVVRSGERVDVRWTVPATAASAAAWIVGCHIPGHYARHAGPGPLGRRPTRRLVSATGWYALGARPTTRACDR